MQNRWPEHLWIVRHGESAGNVARNAAMAAGLANIDIAHRDVDVPLSPLGARQAEALGRWFARLEPDERPDVILTSTYVRARQTADIVCESGGVNPDDLTFVIDERLREKEFGILDRLTKEGIKERFPDQYAFREALGKFYHRPPGGESCCDVILRLRSVVDTISRDYRRERVLIVAHSVVVLCFRYLIERMTEEQILAIDHTDDVANCAITEYAYNETIGRHGRLALRRYNFVAPLEAEGALVTTKKDVPLGPK